MPTIDPAPSPVPRVPLTADEEAAARRPPPPVEWSTVRRVHLLGICGSAMGAFAAMLAARGFEVRGSDRGAYPPMSTRLAELGIPVDEGYDPADLTWPDGAPPDVVVVGNIVAPGYAIAAAVRERRIPYTSMSAALGALFLAGRTSLVVTGTHGKTTTSNMTAWLVHEAGLEPTFLIGGVAGGFGSSHRVGAGAVAVVEGDEYDTAYFDKGPKFLHYSPRFASINNVEFDHADIYEDLEAVVAAFTRFAATMPEDGRLIVPVSDPNARHAAAACRAPVWTFGVERPDASVRAMDVRSDRRGTSFRLELPGESPVEARLRLWGTHNLENALVACALAQCAGAPVDAIVRGLDSFRLPKKRQDVRGVAAGVPVIDDFAHHPTAIRRTLEATRDRFPGRRVLALFEVESNTSRRRVFQDAFAEALSRADAVWFCQPLAKDDGLSADELLDLPGLCQELVLRGTPAVAQPDLDALVGEVSAAVTPDRDVVLAMSGRDFHGVHAKLLEAIADRHGR